MIASLTFPHPHIIEYTCPGLVFQSVGPFRAEVLAHMPVTLRITRNPHQDPSQTLRKSLDLYNDDAVAKLTRAIAERFALGTEFVRGHLLAFVEQLEAHRLAESDRLQRHKGQKKALELPPLTQDQQERLAALQRSPELSNDLNDLLGQSGIVGEESNRISIVFLLLSYMTRETLHIMIQGSSGSGKTTLMHKVTAIFPKEKVNRITRMTDSSLYNFARYALANTILAIEDYDGLSEEAEYALREMQTNNVLRSAVSTKDDAGHIESAIKEVHGPIASIVCTTRGSVYPDNMSRLFILAMDESEAQTARIIGYQNQKAAGLIDRDREKEALVLLQHLIASLRPHDVVNPYATRVHLPVRDEAQRRLNGLYQQFVRMVTLLYQHQRGRDGQGRLVSTKQDVAIAIQLMFEVIVLKVDELDGALRQFFERLKAYIRRQVNSRKNGRAESEYLFTQRELRQALSLSKTQVFRYLHDLTDLEYLRPSGGFQNKGFAYQVVYWDDYKKLREGIKNHLLGQLEALE
jgi:DNA primase